jgi:preprotein translocase subunit Sec63
MDKGNLKLIIKEIEILLETLKSEVYSDVEAYSNRENFDDPVETYITDYDELFDDDDGYPD